MGLGDQAGQCLPGGEELEIEQVGAAALPDAAAESGIVREGGIGPAALGPGAQGDEEQLFPESFAQAGKATGEGERERAAASRQSPNQSARNSTQSAGRAAKARPCARMAASLSSTMGRMTLGRPVPMGQPRTVMQDMVKRSSLNGSYSAVTLRAEQTLFRSAETRCCRSASKAASLRLGSRVDRHRPQGSSAQSLQVA